MAHVEKLRIFLASPGDVNTERRYVENVVEELNRTIAVTFGIVFEVVSSKNAFPGYGKDGQAIINEQLGKMSEYDIFIGIMWNRIGTPTPRAASGTVEEFTNAIKALVRRKKPEVWFYFRQSPSNLTTKEEIAQKSAVVEFKDKFRRNGLFREYKTPAEFQNNLREHLTVWLSARRKSTPKTQVAQKTTPRTPASKASAIKKAEQLQPKSQNSLSGATTRSQGQKAETRRTPDKKSSNILNTGATKSPGEWIMVNGDFFQTKKISSQSDGTITLQIAAKNLEQSATLKSIKSDRYQRNTVIYADSHYAGMIQISSATFETISGKTVFTFIFSPVERSQNSFSGMEFSFDGHSADEIAEMQTRFILLGEKPPQNIISMIPLKFPISDHQQSIVTSGIFLDLNKKMPEKPNLFLPKAWLWAFYALKMSGLIENILKLEITFSRPKILSVKFRGQRRKVYANKEPHIISIAGNCKLNAQ